MLFLLDDILAVVPWLPVFLYEVYCGVMKVWGLMGVLEDYVAGVLPLCDQDVVASILVEVSNVHTDGCQYWGITELTPQCGCSRCC